MIFILAREVAIELPSRSLMGKTASQLPRNRFVLGRFLQRPLLVMWTKAEKSPIALEEKLNRTVSWLRKGYSSPAPSNFA